MRTQANHMNPESAAENISPEKKNSNFRAILRRLVKNKLAMAGGVVLLLLILMAIFAPVLTPYSYSEMDMLNKFMKPCWAHPMGTDQYGRDILARVMYGARYSLSLGLLASLLSCITAVIIGSIAGFFGGIVDNIILRIFDIFQSIPTILLTICISSALGSGFFNTILAMAIGGIGGPLRMMRASVLSIREKEFLEASTAANCSRTKLLLKHIVPNTLSPIIVNTTMGISGVIMAVAGLSYLGLGVQPPTPEWGALLSDARTYLLIYPYMSIFPGIMIGITVLAINFFGDGLRDAMDPKLKN